MEELLKKTKELGCNETSLVAIREWLRVNKGVYLELFYSMFHKTWSVNNYVIDLKKGKKASNVFAVKSFDNYADALLYSLEVLIN